MILASLLDKLNTLRNNLETKIASECTDVSGQNCTATTRATYTAKLDALEAAITSYFSTNHLADRTNSVNEILMTMYQALITSGMSTPDHTIQIPDASNAPNGYHDISAIFKMEPFSSTFLTTTVDDIWAGCDCNGALPLPGLDNLIDQATAAFAAEQMAKQELVNWLKLTNMHNSSIFLFEDTTVSGSRPTKTEIGTELFVNRKAKDVIDYYDLDIRLPSYV